MAEDVPKGLVAKVIVWNLGLASVILAAFLLFSVFLTMGALMCRDGCPWLSPTKVEVMGHLAE